MKQFELHKRYGELLLRIGVNLQFAQGLHIWAPVEAVEFVRILSETAYQIGAANVVVSYFDPMIIKTKMLYSKHEQNIPYPTAEGDLQVNLAKQGYAFLKLNRFEAICYENVESSLRILASDYLRSFQGMKQFTHHGQLQSCSGVVPTASWAGEVYPQLDIMKAIEQLWYDLANICELENSNYLERMRMRLQENAKRRDDWNSRQFTKLLFKGSSCELEVELIDNHAWVGSLQDAKGILYLPNIPTEEIFCANQKNGINGSFSITKPLLFQSKAIHDLHITVKNGRITSFTSKENIEDFVSFINEQESRLFFGEIAFVSKQSVIYQHKVTFGCVLLDENAASHIAIGDSYPVNAKNFTGNKTNHNMNESDIHIDLMFGCDDMKVYAYEANGEVVCISE